MRFIKQIVVNLVIVFIEKRVFMYKYSVGDCFVNFFTKANKTNSLVYIISIEDETCGVRFVDDDSTFHVPFYVFDRLTKIGNIHKDEQLKILFAKKVDKY
jgi:hypothetical protein